MTQSLIPLSFGSFCMTLTAQKTSYPLIQARLKQEVFWRYTRDKLLTRHNHQSSVLCTTMGHSGKFLTEGLQNSCKNAAVFASLVISVACAFVAIITRLSLVELQQNFRANEIQISSLVNEVTVMKTQLLRLREAEKQTVAVPGGNIDFLL